MDQTTRTEIEAAAFRRLITHLQTRTDVQNIDLMILAGFCRNCLSKWYAAAADELGEVVSYEEARERVYGTLSGLEGGTPDARDPRAARGDDGSQRRLTDRVVAP